LDRSLAAAVLAFALSVAISPWAITRLKWLKFGQTISEDVPERHRTKAGTPTMGGLIILGGMTVSALICGGASTLWWLWIILAHGALGFLDDYLIVRRGKALGLRAREKLAGQLILAVLFVLSFKLGAPIAPGSWGARAAAGNGLLTAAAVIWMVGISNAANLTDGLDGLAAGVSAIGAAACGLIASAAAGTTSVISGAVLGGCLGFLWYNAHPAKIIMGDTGSLALGAYFAAVLLVDANPIPMMVVNFIFLAETVTWFMQVGSFKLTGKRIFRMAPIHHHFELMGWPEPRIVARFWIAAAIAGMTGLWMIWQ